MVAPLDRVSAVAGAFCDSKMVCPFRLALKMMMSLPSPETATSLVDTPALTALMASRKVTVPSLVTDVRLLESDVELTVMVASEPVKAVNAS